MTCSRNSISMEIRIMINIWHSLILVFSVLLAGNVETKTAPTGQLKLVAKEVTKGLNQGDRAYAATLTNYSERSIPLELVQLQPGYLGGGIFYDCSLQLWDRRTKHWHTLHPHGLADAGSNPQVVHSAIKPQQQIEVCRRIVFEYESRGGKCVRFALSFGWRQPPDLFSDVFLIPDPDHPAGAHRCPE